MLLCMLTVHVQPVLMKPCRSLEVFHMCCGSQAQEGKETREGWGVGLEVEEEASAATHEYVGVVVVSRLRNLCCSFVVQLRFN